MKKDQSSHPASGPASFLIDPNLAETQPGKEQSQEQPETKQKDQKKEQHPRLTYENAPKFPLRRITIFDQSSIV